MASAWDTTWNRFGINRFGASWGFTPEVVLIERYDIMGSARTSILDFTTANELYANATVKAYTVENGAKTNTLATLYSGILGS